MKPKLVFLRAQAGRADASIFQRIIDWFKDAAKAFALILFTLFLSIACYVYWHWKAIPNQIDWHNAVRIGDNGFFDISYDDGALKRFFSQAQISDFKQNLVVKQQALSKEALQRRRDVLTEAIDLSQAALADKTPPGVLGKPLNSATDDDFQSLDLSLASQWLRANSDNLEPGKRGMAAEIAQGIDSQESWEGRRRQDLASEVSTLETPLSFDWLQFQDSKWVWEVVFWSLFGVLADTIIGLVRACRSNDYSADEFVLVLPKIMLAPLLAVVAVAVWASGITQSPISYLNLPYFLVFAFLLGFAAESVYTRLNDLVDVVVGGNLTPGVAPQSSPPPPQTYKFISQPVDPKNLQNPTNLAQVKQNILAKVTPELERTIVAQLTN